MFKYPFDKLNAISLVGYWKDTFLYFNQALVFRRMEHAIHWINLNVTDSVAELVQDLFLLHTCINAYFLKARYANIHSADKSYVTHELLSRNTCLFWPLFWINVFKEMRPFIIENPIQSDLLWIVNIPNKKIKLHFKDKSPKFSF